MDRIKLAQFGLGPIGAEATRLAVQKPWAEIVGAVDVDPHKIGKSLAEITGEKSLLHARVYPTFDDLWNHAQPQVVLHAASSRADIAIVQIEPIVRRGVSVVSSCEELVYPRLRAPEGSALLDQICQAKGARVLGTGVNPGFVMDVLPICLTGVTRHVDKIYVERVVNASTRRMPLQQKIGSGMEPEEFRRLFREGKAGHAGFRESVALIAHAMGWELLAVDETCEPVIADHSIQTKYFQVAQNLTCGLHQRALGRCDDGIRIELDLKMYLDAPSPHDLIRIEGEPRLEMLIQGGVAGDQATVAALLNAVPKLLKAPPGLRLMTELALPCRA